MPEAANCGLLGRNHSPPSSTICQTEVKLAPTICIANLFSCHPHTSRLATKLSFLHGLTEGLPSHKYNIHQLKVIETYHLLWGLNDIFVSSQIKIKKAQAAHAHVPRIIDGLKSGKTSTAMFSWVKGLCCMFCGGDLLTRTLSLLTALHYGWRRCPAFLTTWSSIPPHHANVKTKFSDNWLKQKSSSSSGLFITQPFACIGVMSRH